MKVFISYSKKDGALADRVVAALEAEGLEAWYDKREILPGDNWAEKLGQGLNESDAMVVLLTPNVFDSGYVQNEIEFALGKKEYNKRLIPVYVGDPNELPTDKIPWIFKHLKEVHIPNQNNIDVQLKQITDVLKLTA